MCKITIKKFKIIVDTSLCFVYTNEAVAESDMRERREAEES